LANQTILQLSNICFNYLSGENALVDINLEIHQGERVALLGANGSGKSTLLKIMDGLLFPQSGTLTAFGEEINEKNLAVEEFSYGFRRRVGYVFQNSDAQLFNANVWDEIAFGPVQLGLPTEEVVRRVDEIISMLELEHLKERPPYKLSGGEKKRVAIAAVLATNPDVLLLDEPTSGLDPRTQRWLVNLLKELGQAGKTIITATHNLDILEEIADQVVVLGEDHRINVTGPCSKVLTNHQLLIKVNLIDDEFHEHQLGGGRVYLHVHD
jgi:cobalt/nickel transport system ATP-binding protein